MSVETVEAADQGFSFEVLEERQEYTVLKIMSRWAADSVVGRLTPTERLELEYASRGYTGPESAKERYVSYRTAKNQRESIRTKLQARNMVHAVRVACEHELFVEKLPLVSVDGLTEMGLYELELASHGLTADEAAALRERSLSTIKHHRENVMQALGAVNMTHAVRLAFDNDILPLA